MNLHENTVVERREEVVAVNDVIANFRWLHRASNLIALNCYHLPTERHGSVSLRLRHMVTSFAVIAAIATLNIFNVRENVSFAITKSIILTQAGTVILTIAALVPSLFILLNMSNRHKIWNILVNLYDFDLKVRSEEIRFYRKTE